MNREMLTTLESIGLTPLQHQAVVKLYNACFESVHPLYEMKDTLTFGDADTKGKRVGKSDRNIELSRYKSKHPIKVRFHRTAAGNVDSILNSGLKTQNDNYGRNTGDADDYDPIVWTSLSPDRIPVLRDFDKKKLILKRAAKYNGYYDEDGNYVYADDDEEPEYEYPYNPPPRYRANIDTLKLTFDKDKYNKMDRRYLPNGRKSAHEMKKVGEDESSVSREGSYKIDLFGEDIDKENISLMKKEDEQVLKELEKFCLWVNNPDGWNANYSTTFNQIKKFLPSSVLSSIYRLMEQWGFNRETSVGSGDFHVPLEKLKWVMQETSKYISQHPYRISSSQAEKGRKYGKGYPYTPADLVELSYVPPKSNRPWMGDELEQPKYPRAARGHISRSEWDCRMYRDKGTYDKMCDARLMKVLGSEGTINKGNGLQGCTSSYILTLHSEAMRLFEPCFSSYMNEVIQRMIQNGKKDCSDFSDEDFYEGIEELYTRAKNSDLYEKWHSLRDELFSSYFTNRASDEKLNILKQILYKKYTFKWAFCAGIAGDSKSDSFDKHFNILQTKLQYV